MTARERAELILDNSAFVTKESYGVLLARFTRAIEDAVEEAKGETMAKCLTRYDKIVQEVIADEREASAKFADKCTKLMHCNVAATIRNRK